ncbi:MAG TPA: 3-oxoacyl-ACP reductase FabG [Candidatus Megaira endosymbiont of Hartmannula sinica]|nr:3-oxoacyl-ACP reductase FabG [Candidatus Megaera endosymbiont of Hartmannula sinica]
MFLSNSLQNQTAFITGASGSIGFDTAKKLSSLGAFVYISGTNKDKLENLYEELGGESKCSIKICDLRDKEKLNHILDDIKNINIMVCNAGMNKDNLSLRMSIDDFDDVLDVNLSASFILNKVAIKKMLRQKNQNNRIINISSVVGAIGNPGQANYSASKAGIVAMSKSLAREVAAKNITINSIAPGFIKSNMTDKLSDQQQEYIMNQIPMKKFGSSKDIANIISFIAMPESHYITGQTIHVNGGMFMQS